LKPYRIRAWPVRKGGDPVNIETFSFLTTTPNPLVATINHERMPVILTREEEFDAWLLGSLEVAFARAAVSARAHADCARRIWETGSTRGRLARGLVQVRHAAAAAATAKVLAHHDRRAVRAKALDVIARIESG
jgi:hypothetical protein